MPQAGYSDALERPGCSPNAGLRTREHGLVTRVAVPVRMSEPMRRGQDADTPSFMTKPRKPRIHNNASAGIVVRPDRHGEGPRRGRSRRRFASVDAASGL